MLEPEEDHMITGNAPNMTDCAYLSQVRHALFCSHTESGGEKKIHGANLNRMLRLQSRQIAVLCHRHAEAIIHSGANGTHTQEVETQ